MSRARTARGLSALAPLLAIALLSSLACCPRAAAQEADDEALLRTLHDTRITAEYRHDFEEIINDLRAQFDLNIHVSWEQLAKMGVRRDRRIEIRLREVPLAVFLNQVLREAAGEAVDEIGWEIEHGVIVIAADRALRAQPLIRMYDVTDFLESGYADRRFFSTPALGLATTGRETLGGENVRTQETRRSGGGFGGGGGGMGGGRGGSMFDSSDFMAVSDMERIRSLIDLMTATITPYDWEDSGGLRAFVRPHNHLLVIGHTVNGHREVERFFERLRARRPVPLDGEAYIVRLRHDQAEAIRTRVGVTFPRIDAAKFDEFVESLGDDRVLFRADTSGLNGRRLWFSALTQRDLLIGVEHSAGDHVVAFRPISGVSTEGLELVVLPLLAPDNRTLLVDVNLAWIPPADISPRPVRLAAGEQGESTIDQLIRRMRTVSTATRIDLGDGLAMSISRELDAQGRASEFEDWLVIRISRAVEADAEPVIIAR